MFKALILTLLHLLQTIEGEGILPDSPYKGSITLMSGPDKDTTQQTKGRLLVDVMDSTHENILNKIAANQNHQHIKKHWP